MRRAGVTSLRYENLARDSRCRHRGRGEVSELNLREKDLVKGSRRLPPRARGSSPTSSAGRIRSVPGTVGLCAYAPLREGRRHKSGRRLAVWGGGGRKRQVLEARTRCNAWAFFSPRLISTSMRKTALQLRPGTTYGPAGPHRHHTLEVPVERDRLPVASGRWIVAAGCRL